MPKLFGEGRGKLDQKAEPKTEAEGLPQQPFSFPKRFRIRRSERHHRGWTILGLSPYRCCHPRT